MKHEIRRTFHPNGQIAIEASYLGGRQNGIERQWHPNGQLASESNWLHDMPNGVNRNWHSNGVLAMEAPVKSGCTEGTVKQWDDKGNLLGSFEMRDGTGIQRIWYPNGPLKVEMSVVNGQFCGRQRTYFEDGEFCAEAYWLKGRQVSKKKYLEACAKDTALPRYEDDGVKPTWKLPSTKYRRRKKLPSEAERKKHDAAIAKIRAKPNQVEARQWLSTCPAGAIRTLGEMDGEGTRETVEDGYGAGAQKIIVVGIQADDIGETSDQMIVELPANGPKRRRVFEWANELALQSGFDPQEDWGQEILFIFFD